MKVYVNWNDPTFVWNGAEDFLWNEAWRIVNEVSANLGGFEIQRRRKPWDQIEERLPKDLADKFLNVVVQVNGLTQTFKKQKMDKTKITVDHIQKTLREFGHEIKVKAEVKK